jgi:diguanylate cyclase (GGDEF)-like protein
MVITQDRQGFMWFGGEGGLTRYDGYRFTSYKNIPGNVRSLDGDYVRALHVDAQNRLWVGTYGGLHLYQPGSDDFIRLRPDEAGALAVPNSDVRAIIDDGRGGLWLGTQHGLQHLDPATGKFSVMHHDPGRPDSLGNDKVNALARDGAGALWIGTETGLDRLTPGAVAFEHYPLHAGRPLDPKHEAVRALSVDRAQNLWIGTMAGLEAWKLGAKDPVRRRFGPAEGAGNAWFTSLYEDREGNLWAATRNDGLWRWDPARQRFAAYRHLPTDPTSVADNHVEAIFHDRTGTLWIGTWANGTSRVDLASGGFTVHAQVPNDPKSLPNNKVTTIAGAPHDQLWLSTSGGGLHLFDPVSGTVVPLPERNPTAQALDPGAVRLFAVDRKGRLRVSTNAGLGWIDPASGQSQLRTAQWGDPLNEGINKLFVDRADALWLATADGLHRLDPNTDRLQSYRHDPADPHSLADNFVYSALEDGEGELWVGTIAGLDHLDRASGRFRHARFDANNPASIGHDWVTCLFLDSKGRFWAGTAAGLSLMDKLADGSVRFKRYPTPSSVDAILEDRDGTLWVSTDAGLSHFFPATGAFKHYTARDGMTEGGFYISSGYADQAGNFYFGGAHGMTAFRGDNIRANPIPPPVVITDFQVFNQSVRNGATPIQDVKAWNLSYRESVFSIEFAALHYADPQRNRYAYQLQGFDKNWVTTDAGKRFATYTNLDPGSYVFRVKAANKDGVWNDTGATLAITITPPYWMTWWFRLLLASLLLGSAWGAYRRRINSLTRQRAVLEDQVKVRTAQVEDQKQLLEQKARELETAYHALEQTSLTDPLTGLRNRRFLDQHLDADIALSLRRYEQWMKDPAQAAPAAADIVFYMIDLDHFKSVNDTYGHAAGDQVLIQIRERLQEVSRESDYLIRWGGEEFLMVARGANRDNAPAVAERIRLAFASRPFELPGAVSLIKTCSIGYACFPFLATRPQMLPWPRVVEMADCGLYLAKHGGRNGWVGLTSTARTEGHGMSELFSHTEQCVDEGALAMASNWATANAPGTGDIPH